MATTRPELVEACKEFVRSVKRLGFRQLRADNDGVLYGLKTARLKVPYTVGRGLASKGLLAELTAKMASEVEKEVAMHGPLVKTPEMMQPVEDIEAILQEGGPPDVGSGAMNPADVGSTPAPPATPGPERSDPLVASEAVVGSTPTGSTTPPPLGDLTDLLVGGGLTPNPEEVMATKRRKDGKRYPEPWTCPKCGETFIQKGRHESSCTGKPKSAVKRASGRSIPEQDKVEKASTNGASLSSVEAYRAHFTAFTKAHADFLVLVEHLFGEVQLYKRENEELRAFKQRASALFEPPSRVPRG